MQYLKNGDRLRAAQSQAAGEVVKLIGGGGQGEVYVARLGSNLFALKWYYAESATPEQRSALEKIIALGPPTDRFLWPFELVSIDGRSGFGYLMPLRPSGYYGLDQLMNKHSWTFRPLLTAAYHLVESFLQLHLKGLCYCDISFGNVFLQPNTGEVLICDNDNVMVNRSGLSGVLGTPYFMAPEIVRGEALPTSQTDLYSLAILLFYLLMQGHPLDGKKETAIRCKDPAALLKLYGREPVFVFDPKDDSNRPDPECHALVSVLWELYPQRLRELFTRAFTAGIHDPAHGRVRETQWCQALLAARDAIVLGPSGAENFYCDDYRRKHGGALRPCWHTRQAVPIPFRLEIGQHMVVLNIDTKLYPHHVDDRRQGDFAAPVAAVAQHPQEPTVWGLKNLSTGRWVFRTAAGANKEVEPGRSVTLVDKTEIDFGTAKGIIRK